MRFYWLAFVTLLCFASHVGAQASTTFVRIAVIDTSGSMRGERIATAKAELHAMARQLPPSKDKPFILVPFNSGPHDVATFTDLLAFERHLANLEAGGGTSIASGLLHALAELKTNAQACSVSLFLITDGEDPDQAGIDAAEEKLDAIFSHRKKLGLPSSVVFKRWENANAQLLQKIAQRGNARVFDIAQFKLVPLTITPTVKVVKAAWLPNRPYSLNVDCQAFLAMTGIPFDASLPQTALRCINSGATAQPVLMRPGDPKPATFRVELALSPTAAFASTTTLHFVVDPLRQFPLKQGLVLPQMPSERLDIVVPLPKRDLDCKLTSSLTETKAPSWSDALRSKAFFYLTITCTLHSVPAQAWPTPVIVRVKPDGCRLVSPNQTLTFARGGSLSLPMIVEAQPQGPGTASTPMAFRVQVDPVAGFKFDPSAILLTHAGQVPAPVETRIKTTVKTQSEARWCDLVNGIATVNADVLFDIDGPMLPDTRLLLVCPSSVRSVAAQPSVVRSGTQMVKLTLTAVLPPAPRTESLSIQIQPPTATGSVQFARPNPLSVSVRGPAPVQVALLNSNGTSPSVTVRDRSAPVVLAGMPVLLTASDPALSNGVSALIRGKPLLGERTHGPLPLNSAAVLPLHLEHPDASFFFDSVIQQDIEVLPYQLSPALIGSRQPCVVTFEAPFKRVLFYTASALAATVVLFLLIRIFLRPAEAKDK